MVDIHTLPIPDWGLRCPSCKTPLAGMRQHRCESCQRPFDTVDLLSVHRPVPDLGLTCTACGYLLRGLQSSICPECGSEFVIREMLIETVPGAQGSPFQFVDPTDHHIRKRDPRFTGDERPLPDFGLTCQKCGAVLAGASSDACPQCGTALELDQRIPAGDWVNITAFVPGRAVPLARAILYEDGIPYLVNHSVLQDVYGIQSSPTRQRLQVPREFFLDALHVLTEAAAPPPASVEDDWCCPTCGEQVPGGFEICWHCQSAHPATAGHAGTDDALSE